MYTHNTATHYYKLVHITKPLIERGDYECMYVSLTIQGVYDVTSTSMKAPEHVIAEIERVLLEMGITYRRKG